LVQHPCLRQAGNKIKGLRDPETSSGWQIGTFYETITYGFLLEFTPYFVAGQE
jgi:hypothetical protein